MAPTSTKRFDGKLISHSASLSRNDPKHFFLQNTIGLTATPDHNLPPLSTSRLPDYFASSGHFDPHVVIDGLMTFVAAFKNVRIWFGDSTNIRVNSSFYSDYGFLHIITDWH